MWLLTSEPHSAWLVWSHNQAQRQSSGSTNLMVPEHAVPSILLFFLRPLPIDSDPRHIINQKVSYFCISQQICCISGNSSGLTSASVHPTPPKKARKNLQPPPSNQPPSNFISATFASCGKSSLQFDLPHHQSGFLVSFLSCPIPPK